MHDPARPAPWSVGTQSPSKPELYRELAAELDGLLADEPDFIANAANAAGAVFHALPDLNWAGFYFLHGAELVLGPFQGRPACTRIPIGKGVCGTAAAERRSVLVPNVEAFPGHIACDVASRSELVVPLFAGEILLGVLDLDSPVVGRFDAHDQAGCETLARVIERAFAMSLRAGGEATPDGIASLRSQ